MHKPEIAAYILLGAGLAASMLFLARSINCADKARVLGAVHRYTITGGCQIKELLLFEDVK